MLHFELRRKVASWQILQRSGAIVRARQNGLRAADFGNTVLLIPKKIAKNHQLANYSRRIVGKLLGLVFLISE